jgi:hypothetical protein
MFTAVTAIAARIRALCRRVATGPVTLSAGGVVRGVRHRAWVGRCGSAPIASSGGIFSLHSHHAEALVDELEAIEVDAEHREPRGRALERPRELLEEERPVRQAGQRVEQPCPASPLEA